MSHINLKIADEQYMEFIPMYQIYENCEYVCSIYGNYCIGFKNDDKIGACWLYLRKIPEFTPYILLAKSGFDVYHIFIFYIGFEVYYRFYVCPWL